MLPEEGVIKEVWETSEGGSDVSFHVGASLEGQGKVSPLSSEEI